VASRVAGGDVVMMQGWRGLGQAQAQADSTHGAGGVRAVASWVAAGDGAGLEGAGAGAGGFHARG
jgi:hypothetical protein